jgi:hypothetical protein
VRAIGQKIALHWYKIVSGARIWGECVQWQLSTIDHLFMLQNVWLTQNARKSCVKSAVTKEIGDWSSKGKIFSSWNVTNYQ